MPATFEKHSRWEFVTWGSGVGGLGFVAAAGGIVVLKSPEGKEVEFSYSGVGAGLSGRLKIPKLEKAPLPKVNGRTAIGAVAPTVLPSKGWLFISSYLEKDELSEADLRGLCCFAEAGVGLYIGVSGVGMLLGLDAKRLPLLALPIPGLQQYFFDSAKALLVMAGPNAGPQAGGGIAAFLGSLH